MAEEYKNLDKLEQYFDGTLSETEMEALRKELKDKDFRKDALFLNLMEEVLSEKEEARLDKMLEDVDTDEVNQDIRTEMAAMSKRLQTQKASPAQEVKIRTMRPMRRLLALAASLLVLVVAGILWRTNRSYNPNELIAQSYYAADVPGSLSGGAVEDEAFQAALAAFVTNNDWATARAGFEQIANTNSKYGEAQYFLGHINLQEAQFEIAIENYQNALASENLPNYINQNKLNWNLLLARLGSGEDIRSDLDRLIEAQNPPYNQKAINLKKRLK